MVDIQFSYGSRINTKNLNDYFVEDEEDGQHMVHADDNSDGPIIDTDDLGDYDFQEHLYEEED